VRSKFAAVAGGVVPNPPLIPALTAVGVDAFAFTSVLVAVAFTPESPCPRVVFDSVSLFVMLTPVYHIYTPKEKPAEAG
jgi:hypothetical protein